MVETLTVATGRVFLVGDIHGCLGLLEQAKAAIKFKDDEDLMIGVGDLVDRGPDSPGCLELLDKGWFRSVKGNHEEILFEDYKFFKKTGQIYPIENVGNHWVEEYFKSSSPERLINKASNLPEVIKLNAFGKRYHVVHGSLCKGERSLSLISDEDLDDNPRLSNSEVLYWESLAIDKMKNPKKGLEPYFIDGEHPFIEGHSLAICGHTTFQDYPVLSSSHFHIDTGAIRSFKDERSSMSILEISPDLKRLHQISPIWGHYFFAISEF